MGFLSRATNNISGIAEKRWHPAKWPGKGKNVERWLITGDTGKGSYTGKDIDEESAMTHTAVWSAVTQLSQLIASLPLHLYVRKSGRGKDRAINHYQYSMLHIKPNPFMGSMSLREAFMGQTLRWGTGFCEKELDNMGRVIRLWPLLSKDIQVDILFDNVVYIVPDPRPGGKKRILDGSRILRVNGFSSNGILGFNPIEYNRESIALGLALEEYSSRFFGNNARPSAVLEHPQQLNQEAQDRLRKSWNEIHEGLENAHRIAILEEGMKLHEFGTTPEDSQLNESKRYNIEDIARIFNIPVYMLKNLDRATNNNIEYVGLDFVRYSLRPWLVKLEQEFTIQLLSEKEQKKYFYEHLIDGLLRGDTKTRHEAYKSGRQWGYYSANDVLEMENRNGIGDQGDIYLVPMNMTPANRLDDIIDKNVNVPKENNGGNDPSNNDKKSFLITDRQIERIKIVRDRINKSYSRLFKDAVTKILNRECIAIKRSFKSRDKDKFESWIDTFYESHTDYVRKGICNIVESFVEQISHQALNEIFVDEKDRNYDFKYIVDDIINSYIEFHINISKNSISFICNDNEINKWIDDISIKNSNDLVSNIANIICDNIFSRFNYLSITRVIKNEPCEECSKLDSKKYEGSNKNCCCIVTI